MHSETTSAKLAIDACDGLGGLARTDWFAALEELTDDLGYFEPVGAHHSAVFVDQSTRLLVTFDSYTRAVGDYDKGLPEGLTLAAKRGWSFLSIIAHDDTPASRWFRTRELFGYFDRLVMDGFFEDFDQVVFYGAGLAGHAASAYSVAASGSTVIAISPQVSPARDVAPWDSRYPEAQDLDISRYGYAPDMLDGVDRAFVLFNPAETEDRHHAELFERDHVELVPCRRFGADIDRELKQMGAFGELLETAMRGQLDRTELTHLLRKRRTHLPYLRRILGETSEQDTPLRVALLSRHVLREYRGANRFRKAQVRAEQIIAQREANS